VSPHQRVDRRRVAGAEPGEQLDVRVLPAVVLVAPVVPVAERQPDIALGRVPQVLQRADVPVGGRRREQPQVEVVVRLVDRVGGQPLVAERCLDRVRVLCRWR
jgi:hypothetical protein